MVSKEIMEDKVFMRHTLRKNTRITVDIFYGLRRSRVARIIKNEAYIVENIGLGKQNGKDIEAVTLI